MKVERIRFFHDPAESGAPYTDTDDEEVEIELADGRKYYGWFFTLDKIKEVMARHRSTGESNKGIYFWATNMIVVEVISKERIEATVRHLIEKEKCLTPFDLVKEC